MLQSPGKRWRRWERKNGCSQIGTNYGTLFKPKDSVLIGDHLIFVGSHIVYLGYPRDKGGNSPESEDGASLGFYPWLPLINRSNTKKKGFFFGCFFPSDPICVGKTSFFFGDWDNFEPMAGTFSAKSREQFACKPSLPGLDVTRTLALHVTRESTHGR